MEAESGIRHQANPLTPDEGAQLGLLADYDRAYTTGGEVEQAREWWMDLVNWSG